MNAQEMFEKLGYKKNVDSFGQYIRFERHLSKSEFDKGITFDTINKNYYAYNDYGFATHISMDEFNAIIQQIREFGWLE